MTNTTLAILVGGGAVAILDGVAATVDFRLRGISFTRLWQGVASGALGPKSFQLGSISALLGLFFHVLIAASAAVVFNIAAGFAPALVVHYIASGAVYGVAVFLVMNLAVIPLSAMPPRPFSLPLAIRQILVHIFWVGLPISTAARWFSNN
jgi:hypothetical protein